jgi:hypothetical protein
MTVDVERELRELMHERAERVQPVDGVVHLVQERAASRSRRQVAVVATAVLAAAATVVAAVILSGSSTPAAPLPAASRPAAVPSRVLPDVPVPPLVMAAALDARREGTVVGPVQWLRTTSKAAEAFSGYTPGRPDQQIYLVQVQGQFVLDSAPRPMGAPSPTGTAMVLVIPLVTSDQGGGGLRMGQGPMDLSYLGDVHSFTLP